MRRQKSTLLFNCCYCLLTYQIKPRGRSRRFNMASVSWICNMVSEVGSRAPLNRTKHIRMAEGYANSSFNWPRINWAAADLSKEWERFYQHCSRNDHQEPDNQHQPPQQQSETEIGRVSSHSLSGIHSRYDKVLQVIYDNRCSMANAFRLAGCPRSTVRDFVAIAELKIVDHREHERVIRDHVGSIKELEVTCRKRLRRCLPVMANLRREGKLLPLKFDERFYE